MTTPKNEHTAPANRLAAVLEAALRGHTATRIAREVPGYTPDLVDLAVAAHGYPSAKALRTNAEHLRALGEQKVTYSLPGTASTPVEEPAGPEQPPAAAAEAEPTAAPASPPAGTSADALLASAAAHDLDRIRNLGKRAQQWLDRLAHELEADTADAKRRARIAELEAELHELKQVKPTRGGGVAATGEFPCDVDGCTYVATSPQGRGGHKRMAHTA